MRPHEKLDVWKKSIEFVVAAYENTDKFPSDEKFGLTSQIRRASVSIPANIAEGAARTTTKEFLYFLSIAQGSVSEVETELLIAKRLGFLSNESFDDLSDRLGDIGKMLMGLRNHLSKRLKKG